MKFILGIKTSLLKLKDQSIELVESIIIGWLFESASIRKIFVFEVLSSLPIMIDELLSEFFLCSEVKS